MDFEQYEIESACIDGGFSFSLSGDEDLKESIQQARAIKASHRFMLRDFDHWTPYEIRPRSETYRTQAD